MKFVFEFIGYNQYCDEELMSILIRSSGTTGNITEDHRWAFTYSAYIKNGEVVEFKGLGPNKVFGVGHRAGFKANAMTYGFKDVGVDFLENKWSGISDELLENARECMVFQIIKYYGD